MPLLARTCMCTPSESTRSSHVIFTHFSPTDSPNLSLPLHTACSWARRERRKEEFAVWWMFSKMETTKKRDGPSTLRDGRRLWLLKGSWGGPDTDVGGLLHIPRWAFFFLSKVMKTVHSFNIEHNTDRMKMHRYPCLTAMLVTSHHSRSCE